MGAENKIDDYIEKAAKEVTNSKYVKLLFRGVLGIIMLGAAFVISVIIGALIIVITIGRDGGSDSISIFTGLVGAASIFPWVFRFVFKKSQTSSL